MPWPTPVPVASATSDEPTPRASASERIERCTWRRVAPTQRIRAKSRCRWANRIENVLAITSTETKRAMAANSSSTIAITSTPLLASTWTSATKSSRDCTVASGAIAVMASVCCSSEPGPAQATLSTYVSPAQVARSAQGT